MRLRVNQHGLIIPKELLNNSDEFEIRQEKNILLLIPIILKDPLSEFGTDPIVCDVDDASIRHDYYLCENL